MSDREVVSRHFAEWGEIDRIRVLTSRGVAFVRADPPRTLRRANSPR